MGIDILVDVLFWLDLLMTFFVGFKPNRSLNTVYDLKLIRERYLRRWFLVDFIAAFPVNRILDAAISGWEISESVEISMS